MSGARCGGVVNYGHRCAGTIPLFINGLRRVTASECSADSVIRIPSTCSGWKDTTRVRRNSRVVIVLLQYSTLKILLSNIFPAHFLCKLPNLANSPPATNLSHIAPYSMLPSFPSKSQGFLFPFGILLGIRRICVPSFFHAWPTLWRHISF